VDDQTRQFVQGRGWRDPASVVKSYRELEQHHTKDGTKITLPKDANDKAGWDGVWKALGRPDKPDGYQIVPEGKEPTEFQKWAQATFHEIGLPKAQAEALRKAWDARFAEESRKAEVEAAAQAQRDMEALQSEHGQAYPQFLEEARRGMRMFIGTPKRNPDGTVAQGDPVSQTLDGLEMVFGAKGMMEFFNKIGKAIGEDGGTGTPASSAAFLSPQAAQNRIATLRNDSDFQARIAKGDAAAQAEWDNLYRRAYPEQQT
jgi:hypothetical protein